MEGESTLITVLRLASSMLAATSCIIALTWPLIIHPALNNTIGFDARDRFMFWKSYDQRLTPIGSFLSPLLTITLSLSALFAPSFSLDPIDGTGGRGGRFEGDLSETVKLSRKSIFIVGAILTLAHRPYNFTFLAPRRETLVEYDRKQLARPVRVGRTSASSSLSPVGREGGDPNVSQEEVREVLLVNPFEPHRSGSPEKLSLTFSPVRIDTDEIIQEITRLQYGTIFLSALTFLLTLMELVCV